MAHFNQNLANAYFNSFEIWIALCKILGIPHHILRSKYRTWPYLAKGKGEIQRMFLWAYLLIIASGFKAGELIWPSVVLSRALLG